VGDPSPVFASTHVGHATHRDVRVPAAKPALLGCSASLWVFCSFARVPQGVATDLTTDPGDGGRRAHAGYVDIIGWRIEAAFWDIAHSVRVAAGVRSIWDVAGVRTCKTSGWWNRCAIGLFLNDWRDVDAAIAGIGSWFAREHFSGEVVLRIEAKRKAILL